jgi:hypothetical protein
MTNLTLDVILWKEADNWIVQGLQKDIAAQGSTINDAMKRFARVLVAEIVTNIREGKEPLQGIDAAPRTLLGAMASINRR